jgi:hypothetical protein
LIIVTEFKKFPAKKGMRFRKDRPSYADMMKFSADQRSFFDPAEEGISCFCGD